MGYQVCGGKDDKLANMKSNGKFFSTINQAVYYYTKFKNMIKHSFKGQHVQEKETTNSIILKNVCFRFFLLILSQVINFTDILQQETL